MSGEASHVVVGFDFSHSGHAALVRAIGVAARAPWHVLHFVCVIDKHSAIPAVPTDHIDLEYVDRVQQALTRVVAQELEAQLIGDRVHFFVHARIGKPAEEIVGVAEDVGADLIIVGCNGLSSLERILVGSVAEKVVRHAQCTVEVARATSYKHVPLLEMTEVEANHDHAYAPPHRYSYEDRRVNRRPNDWPLY